MIKIFLTVLIQMLFVSCSSAFMGVDTYDDFYEYDVEPRIDTFCRNVLSKAEDIVLLQRPLLKVQLTQEERYFSKEDMEYFGTLNNGLPITEQYSSVSWLGVWCDGKTLVRGWAKEDQRFHADYIYTVDTQIVFIGGIHVGIDISVIEKFFGANLYDMSVRLGLIRYPFLGNDDFTVPVLELFYNQYKVECIEVWYDVVVNDVVPVVPRVSRVNDFVDRELSRMKGNVRRTITSNIQSDKGSEQAKTGLDSPMIIIIFLAGGTVISIIIWGLIEFISYIMTGSATPSYSEKVTLEAEVIDAEFSDDQRDDYDYPYEDIGEVLRDIK